LSFLPFLLSWSLLLSDLWWPQRVRKKSSHRSPRTVNLRKAQKKNRLARERGLKPIDLVSASQIAVTVIELFNRKELLDITAALETQKEIKEAIQIIHEKLRPEYQKQVRIWYQTEHAIAESALTTVAIEASVDEAMEKGLIALRKSEDIATLFNQTPKGAAARPIEKKKTWSEIADGR